MRFTKIICTLGPSSRTKEQIRSLLRGGMNVARINMSHGASAEHRETIRFLREINREIDASREPCHAATILLDTKGAEVRTGDVARPLQIGKGEEVIFSAHPLPGESRQVIIVDHPQFGHDVRSVERILLDNGELNFDTVEIRPDGSVVARAREAGSIGSRRHVNLPGAHLTLPPFTEKDWQDIAFAAAEEADFLALSFVREAKDVHAVRTFLAERGSNIPLIAKIETNEAVANIGEIIRASDGVMVARGDLGAEVPFERVPVIQDEIVELCKEAGKPVIVATHMLESMIHQPMPTRAEVTDIAHAATTRTDATMLSGETASGEHPLASLDAMDRVLRETEAHMARFERMEEQAIHGEREARAEAAVTLAIQTNAAALVVITKSGQTARDVCKFRPNLPIIAFAPNREVQRRLQLSFGVLPFSIAFSEDPEATVAAAMQEAVRCGVLTGSDRVVLVSDAKAHEVVVNTIQMRNIG